MTQERDPAHRMAPAMDGSTNPSLPGSASPFHERGNFAPVVDEITAFDLKVVGAIPAELEGRYFRNGSNPQAGRSPHWFTGDGMLHGVRLSGGKAEWYRNRWVRTRQFHDPDLRMVGPDGSVDRTVGVSNTHVVRHADKILALVESSFPYEVSAELGTVGVYDYDGRLGTAMTAHPKVCPVTGEMHFFGYSFAEPCLTYHRVSANGELVQSETIDVAGPTMMHDFAITEHHVLFMDLPVVFDIELAIKGNMPYRWSDDYPARIGVMARTAPGDTTSHPLLWFDVDPCYVFHCVNAFERTTSTGSTEIVLDTARYNEMWRQNSSAFTNDANLHRWTIDPDAGTVAAEQLDDREIEFPRVADDKVGLAAQYGYAVATFGDTNSLVKYDLTNNTETVHDFGDNRIPGEAVFVPSADRAGEDDGWLFTYAYDKSTDTSDLVILDATNIAADPLAAIQLPQRVPFGFHGSWFADNH